MIATPDRWSMTPEEYLTWEAQQSVRHEYFNGEVYAMTGGALPHNTIAINLTTLLKQPVRSRGCQIFMADVKVRIGEVGNPYMSDALTFVSAAAP